MRPRNAPKESSLVPQGCGIAELLPQADELPATSAQA
jgi:hypothetical protein